MKSGYIWIAVLFFSATSSVSLRGAFTARSCNVRPVYEPQIMNGNLEEWTNNKTPVGWSTANNTFVTTTTRANGNPGYAAQIKTTSTLGKIASGALFLGDFNRRNNILAGLTDPISLTFFGLPFKTSGKILGIQFDAVYTPGKEFISGNDRELGFCSIELLKPKPGREKEEFVYHGNTSAGVYHKDNMAYPVAQKRILIGNSEGTAWNGYKITVVSNTTWTTVQMLFDYPNGEMPDFTHFHVVFASSAQGDTFRGVKGSTLTLDNIRIIYEEEK